MSTLQETFSKDFLTVEQLQYLAENFTFDIVQEWDFKKNEQYFPEVPIMMAKPKSSKKIWWKCSKEHSYDASLKHKTGGLKCPICSNRRLLQGYNDFATKHPELVSIWQKCEENPSPHEVLFCTMKVVIQWYCEAGHFYPTTPLNISRGRGCSFCHGTKVLIGFNDLASKAPESAVWWDYAKNDKTPEEVRYGSKVKVWWICPLGHSYTAAIQKFYVGRRCAVCAGKVIHETTKITNSHPHLTSEWDFEKNTYLPDTISAGHDRKVWWKCQKCEHEWEAYVYNRTHKTRPQGCPTCAKGATSSRGERQVAEFLTQHGLTENDIITHKRIQNADNRRFEIDVFIPSLNTGIEFNGVYYHSELFVEKDYHYHKMNACQEHGIRLIQIWEDDWNLSRGTVEHMLLQTLNLSIQEKIHANTTVVQNIPQEEAAIFFDTYHMHGSVDASAYIGLVSKNDNTLVAVMAVLHEKNENTLSILRYATSYPVMHGFRKLLTHIEKHYSIESIVTTSDNCISDGMLYTEHGFTQDVELPPDYSYLVKKQRREQKSKYTLDSFKNNPDLLWEESMTEQQLVELNGLLKIYDAGSIRWVKHIRNHF